MRRLGLSAFLLLLSSCGGQLGGAFPAAVVPPRPVADDWPDAGAAIIDDVATLEFRIVQREKEKPRVVVTLDHRRRLKILDEPGLRHATIALRVDGFSTVTKIVARSVSPKGDVATMAGSSARAVAVPGAAGASGEMKDLTFTIPGAVVGGLVEYRYQRVFVDPHMVPAWVFGGALPVVRAELGIIVDDDLKVDYRYGRGTEMVDNLPLRRKRPDGRERLVWVETDLPAYYREPNMPHDGRVAPWIAVVLSQAKIWGEKKRLQTWQDVGERLRGYQERVGGEPAKGNARRRFRRVRDTTVALPLDGLGLRQPVPVGGMQRGEPACSRDAAAYLLKALEGSRAKAYPAFLTGPTGPMAPQDLPGLYPFTRAVVAIDVADEIAKDTSCRADPVKRGLLCTVPPDSFAFLDPLCSFCRYGELPTEYTGGRALVLLEDGPRWVDVPIDPPERNRVLMQLQLSMAIDGSIKGALSGEATGAPARRLRTALKAASRGDQRDEALTAGVVGDGTPVQMYAAKYKNPTNVDKALGFKARMKSEVEKIDIEHFLVRPADLAGPVLPGAWRTTRRYDAILEAPFWSETVVSLDLPVGYEVEPPGLVKLVEPFAEYAAGFARRERTLTYSRRLVIKRHLIRKSDWPAFRRFIDQIDAVEQRGVQVRISDGAQ